MASKWKMQATGYWELHDNTPVALASVIRAGGQWHYYIGGKHISGTKPTLTAAKRAVEEALGLEVEE